MYNLVVGTPSKMQANRAKFVCVMMTMCPEFRKRMFSGNVVIFQGNAPCHVSRDLSKHIDLKVLDLILFSLGLVENFDAPKSNLPSCPHCLGLKVTENLFTVL